jgi:hypothetical protein
MKGPNPTSKRSKRRANRGFKSLELSCRIHRRAFRRLREACNIGNNKHLNPGEKGEVQNGASNRWLHTAGGSIKYW